MPMEIIRKTIKVKDAFEFYKAHMKIISSILPVSLTNKEIEVLAAFSSLEGVLRNLPFSTKGRKVVMEKLGMTPGGLGNYLSSLKEKGLLLEQEDLETLEVNPIIKAEGKEQGYQFKILIHEGNI